MFLRLIRCIDFYDFIFLLAPASIECWSYDLHSAQVCRCHSYLLVKTQLKPRNATSFWLIVTNINLAENMGLTLINHLVRSEIYWLHFGTIKAVNLTKYFVQHNVREDVCRPWILKIDLRLKEINRCICVSFFPSLLLVSPQKVQCWSGSCIYIPKKLFVLL